MKKLIIKNQFPTNNPWGNRNATWEDFKNYGELLASQIRAQKEKEDTLNRTKIADVIVYPNKTVAIGKTANKKKRNIVVEDTKLHDEKELNDYYAAKGALSVNRGMNKASQVIAPAMMTLVGGAGGGIEALLASLGGWAGGYVGSESLGYGGRMIDDLIGNGNHTFETTGKIVGGVAGGIVGGGFGYNAGGGRTTLSNLENSYNGLGSSSFERNKYLIMNPEEEISNITPIQASKTASVNARPAKEGEVIKTVLKDGTEETVNTAKSGDYVVTNPGGELYVVPKEQFELMYTLTNDGLYVLNGLVRDLFRIDRDFELNAPWGRQFGKRGSYIVRNNGSNGPEYYVLGADEAAGTYRTLAGKRLYTSPNSSQASIVTENFLTPPQVHSSADVLKVMAGIRSGEIDPDDVEPEYYYKAINNLIKRLVNGKPDKTTYTLEEFNRQFADVPKEVVVPTPEVDPVYLNINAKPTENFGNIGGKLTYSDAQLQAYQEEARRILLDLRNQRKDVLDRALKWDLRTAYSSMNNDEIKWFKNMGSEYLDDLVNIANGRWDRVNLPSYIEGSAEPNLRTILFDMGNNRADGKDILRMTGFKGEGFDKSRNLLGETSHGKGGSEGIYASSNQQVSQNYAYPVGEVFKETDVTHLNKDGSIGTGAGFVPKDIDEYLDSYVGMSDTLKSLASKAIENILKFYDDHNIKQGQWSGTRRTNVPLSQESFNSGSLTAEQRAELDELYNQLSYIMGDKIRTSAGLKSVTAPAPPPEKMAYIDFQGKEYRPEGLILPSDIYIVDGNNNPIYLDSDDFTKWIMQLKDFVSDGKPRYVGNAYSNYLLKKGYQGIQVRNTFDAGRDQILGNDLILSGNPDYTWFTVLKRGGKLLPKYNRK